MTVKLPAVERIGEQPFGPTASIAHVTGPVGTLTPRNCGVVDVATCVAPRKRRYCAAPKTALAEKSTGETSSALSVGATRIGASVRQFAGGVKRNCTCAESTGSQPLKSVRTKNSNEPSATGAWSDGLCVEATIDGVAPASPSHTS